MLIHDQGLVTVLRQIHAELDAAVLEAYGWSDLSERDTGIPACSSAPGASPEEAGRNAYITSPEESEISFDELFKECRKLDKQIEGLADRLSIVASAFDSIGDVKSHPESSAKRRFAELRDHADMCLAQAARHLMTLVRIRAETSHSADLMVEVISMARGDGDECLRLIRFFHERTGDDKCRRSFPVKWRNGGWNKMERGKRLWVVRQVPFRTSQREFGGCE